MNLKTLILMLENTKEGEKFAIPEDEVVKLIMSWLLELHKGLKHIDGVVAGLAIGKSLTKDEGTPIGLNESDNGEIKF